MKPKKAIKTLITEYLYPRHGPGMMWNTVKTRVEELGGQVQLNRDVVKIRRDGRRIEGVVFRRDGVEEKISGTDFILSVPIREFVGRLDPPAPDEILMRLVDLDDHVV